MVYPCMQGGSQSPQLLAPGDTSSQGHGSTPVDGADHFTSIHEYTCAHIQSWPGLPWSCSSHTYADGTYSQGPHRHYSLSSSWLGVFWSPVANCTVVSPLETPWLQGHFHLLAGWSVLICASAHTVAHNSASSYMDTGSPCPTVPLWSLALTSPVAVTQAHGQLQPVA